jgi:tetratricopeptide (TPR) repeat protein
LRYHFPLDHFQTNSSQMEFRIRGPLTNRVQLLRPDRVLGITMLLWVCAYGCGRADVGDPVAVGLDAQDTEMADFLRAKVAAVRSDPRSASLRGELAISYHANGFKRASATTFHQAALLDPGDFRWPYFHALTLAKLGEQTEALEALQTAIELDAQYAPAWLWRGTWLADLGREGEALTAFERASSLAADAPTEAAAAAGIGLAQLRSERPDAAVAVLEPAVAEFEHPYLHQLLARAYRRLGREPPDSPTEAARVRSLGWPDPRVPDWSEFVRGFQGRLRVASNLLNQGRAAEAATLLERLDQSHPNNALVLSKLGIAEMRAGRPGHALEVLVRGLEADPSSPLMHYNVAILYTRDGHGHLALPHLDRALELNPGFVAAYQTKALVLAEEERHEEALTVLETAARYAPTPPATLSYLGSLAAAHGRWATAIAFWEHLLELDSENARGQLQLGRALGEAGHLDSARLALARARELGADVTVAERRLAVLSANVDGP